MTSTTLTQQLITIFGMTLLSIILVCLVWTILKYILRAIAASDNRIEEHFKHEINHDKLKRSRK